MRTCTRVSITLVMTFVGSTMAAEGRLTLSAEEIQEKCFREAGIPENDPNHAITEQEYNAVLACAERYIDR